jgi:3',5'-cyclic-AMP phosphodiesterase
MSSAGVIAHVTDSHLGQKLIFGHATLGKNKMGYESEPSEHRDNLKAVFDDVAEKGISDVVFGGDIGAPEANGWFFDLVRSYGFRFRLLLGNHDNIAEVRRHFRADGVADGGTELFSSCEEDGLKTIFMDSSSNAISQDQLKWLRGELGGQKKVLLFLHHPVLAIDTPVETLAALKNRDSVRALLWGASCDVVVVCGHYHMNDDVTSRNIRQLCTPAVSYQIVKDAAYVEIDASRFGYRLIETNGVEIATRLVWFDAAGRTSAPPLSRQPDQAGQAK